MATLLLADDSVTIQRVMALTFANEAIRVVTAADGNAATAILEAERPDIVLADVGLPAVDGYTLAERLKRHPATAGIPVLLLTGAFEPIDEGRARRTGCDGVLVKPFEPHRVVSLVKALLAGQTPDNLWPNDMPRIDTVGQTLPTLAPRPQTPLRDAVSEPAATFPLSDIEEGFEMGLDDLDLAFSRLDPVAPPSRIDADAVSDFQRDIQELRKVLPEPESPPAAPPRPIAASAPAELPRTTPAAGAAPPNIPVLSTPWTPPVAPPVEIPAPPPPPVVEPPVTYAPAPVVPVAPPPFASAPAELQLTSPTPSASAPPELLRTSPTPPPPPTPPTPPTVEPPVTYAPEPVEPVEPVAPPPPPTPLTPLTPLTPAAIVAPPAPELPPQITAPTLAAAFSALLAAEQSQPAAAKLPPPERSSSDAMVEAVVRRVAARLTGEVDRLVREELERLKR